MGAHALVWAEHTRRVAAFTDRRLAGLPHLATVLSSLKAGGLDAVINDEVKSSLSIGCSSRRRSSREGRFDGYVSVDTCKAANLYATHPADFLACVNAPPSARGAR